MAEINGQFFCVFSKYPFSPIPFHIGSNNQGAICFQQFAKFQWKCIESMVIVVMERIAVKERGTKGFF